MSADATLTTKLASLDGFLNPKGVALIGASDRSAFSRTAHAATKLIGFEEQTFLISRSGGQAHDRGTISDMREINGKADIAVFMIPGDGIMEKVEEVAEAGIRFAIVLASGFGELGSEGKAKQDALLAKMHEHGIRMMGPNCLGFINYLDRTAACTMKSQVPLRIGNLAIVSQSGAIASGMARFAHQQGIGLSHIVATGNEADIDFTEIAPQIIADDRVGAICFFIEMVRNPERFFAMAELAQQHSKPLVMIKVGASPLSAQVAAAHTGALVGDDSAFDAVCHHYGIMRVHSLEDAVLTAALAGHTGRIGQGGLGMLSISGGACEIVADAAASAGVELVPFAPETVEKLSNVLPDFCTASNPLDVTGGVVANPQMFEEALAIVGEAPGVAMIGVVQPLPAKVEVGASGELLRALGRGFKRIPVPGAMVNQAVTPVTEVGDQAIVDAELPHVTGGLNTFIDAAARIFRWSRHLDAMPPPLRRASQATDARPKSEIETLRYLASKGVPTIPFEVVQDGQAVSEIASRLGDKLVVKIASPDILHKTEAGGVMLNVAADEADEAVRTVIERARAYKPNAQIEGALVAPMRSSALEFVVGIARDPQWGPVLAIGLGGIWVEVMQDVQLRLAGTSAKDIAGALQSLRAAKLLGGYRGSKPVDVERLAQVIESIAAAAIDLGPKLAALEINPLRVDGSEIEALDALAIWEDD